MVFFNLNENCLLKMSQNKITDMRNYWLTKLENERCIHNIIFVADVPKTSFQHPTLEIPSHLIVKK